MSLRVATIDDIDALTTIHVLAMPMDPNFPYLFPNVSHYQTEYFEFTKDGIISAMNISNNSVTTLIEISDPFEPLKKRIIAFATWELSDSSEASRKDPQGPHEPFSNDDSEYKDKTPARIWHFLPKARWDVYIPAATNARRDTLEERYGRQQIFLGEMVVHPEFQRRGFGKVLMQWGIEKARQEKCAITTFASAAGRVLYESFGMREIGSFRTQVEGEDRYIDNPILAMDAPV